MARPQQQRDNRNQIVALEPVRMQMPAHVAEEYHIDPDSWRALTDAIFPLAKTVGAVLLALAYCKKRKLDIFQRPVHIVPMYVNGRTVETVWPGIAQVRITAQREEAFAGFDECTFGEDKTETFRGKKNAYDGDVRSVVDVEASLTFPEWAQFTVYKMLHGQRTALPGPKVYFMETFASCSHFGGEVPNDRWQRAPRQMLEKCAEAAAYRRAFPDVLGNEMAAEEMEGRRLDPTGAIEAEYVEVTETGAGKAKATPEKKPRREDFKQEGAAQEDDTGGEGDQVFEGEREFHAGETIPFKIDPSNRDALDRPGIPGTDEQWTRFETDLAARLQLLPTRQAVDAEQEKQQFRLDAAPLKVQQRLYAMFTEVSADKPEAGGDNGSQNA